MILHYLRLALVPYPLVLDYDWPVAKGLGEWLPQTLVVLRCSRSRRGCSARRSWIGFAAACVLRVPRPDLGIVPIMTSPSEHRTYLPLAGVLALLVGGGYWLCVRFAASAPRLPAVVAPALCLAFTALTVPATGEYRASDDLWRTVVERAPANPRGHSNLAHELIGQGKLDEAMAELGTALKLDPRITPALHRLGNVHRMRGASGTRPSARTWTRSTSPTCPPIATGCLRVPRQGASARPRPATARRSSSSPTRPENHLGLANALNGLDRKPEAEGELPRGRCGSIPSCRRRTRTSPRSCSPRARRARPSSTNLKALSIPPNTVQEQYNVGSACSSSAASDEALQKRLRAVSRIAPTMPEPEIAIAKALLAKKDATREERAGGPAAREKANESTSSKRADVLETLAMASAANGDPASAVALVQQALELPGPTRNAAFRERLMAQLAQYKTAAGQ
mgnify:CR=1 FL=1